MSQTHAKQILGLLDLTSLNDNDNSSVISDLCHKTTNKYGHVPAICIYSRFIPVAKQNLHTINSAVKIATVTNFPHGSDDLDLASYETTLAINRGCDEVDIVFPYHLLIRGNSKFGGELVKAAKAICGKKTLKVIIESGVLKTEKLIKLASEISLENGADFIKTSTGKVPVNATLEAAEIMLHVIKSSGKHAGFKAAGGIRTVADAIPYLELANKIMGKDWINANTFRFGASSLLNDVIAILEGQTLTSPNISGY